MVQDTPSREKLRELNAIPAKDILKNKARVCPPLPAICEIMDNIFDNYEENGSHHDLAISFIIKTVGDGEISIAENSGGVRETKLEPLVRLGVAYHAARGSIGTWGEGLKVAAFSLGSEFEIFTHFPGEQPVVIHFGKDWLDTEDWSVPLYSISDEAPSPGSTLFRIRHLHRPIDWADIMREISVIYGHKIQPIIDSGKRVHINFDVEGGRTSITPRPLASPANLRKRFAFPPDFPPRKFTATWRAEHGTVKCRLIIGLTPRHSGETSGVYMYRNGRMFARALRSRAVGYGEGGNAVLRDHPSCWRIQAYAFLEADDGADIPWQAPLKDGVSENHVITTKFREMFKEAVAPYSRFAKIAKASELVPFTAEWEDMNVEQRAETLFRSKAPQVLDQVRNLPQEIRNFAPPAEIETVRIDGVAGEELVRQLDQHAKFLRQLIVKRDAGGPALELEVLRALYPSAFSDEGPGRNKPHPVPPPKKGKVTIELDLAILKKLKAVFKCSTDVEAIISAVNFTISKIVPRRSGKLANPRR